MTAFQHKPLDLSRQQIRLLEIYYDERPTSSIKCSIRVFNLEDCPAYEALSYTWGPATPQRHIMIDQSSFAIRMNLWDFLSHLSKPLIKECLPPDPLGQREGQTYRPAFLWVDQLCIDQNNVKERNHQVQIMSLIFQKAERVAAWLGVGSHDSAAGMTFLAKTADIYTRFGWEYDWKEYINSNFSNTEAVRALTCRCYWSRLWIVQEFLQARRLIIICGTSFNHFEHWRTSTHMTTMCLSLDRKLYESMAERMILARSSMSTRSAVYTRPLGFCIAFEFFGRMGCEDVRDKIYGLMPLFFGAEKVDVDYDKAPNKLFWSALPRFDATQEYSKAVILHLGIGLGVTGTELDETGEEVPKVFRKLFGECHPTEVFSDPLAFAARDRWARPLRRIAFGENIS